MTEPKDVSARPTRLFAAIGCAIGCTTAWVVWSTWENYKLYAIETWGAVPYGVEMLESIRLLFLTIVLLCVVVLTALGFVVGRLWRPTS